MQSKKYKSLEGEFQVEKKKKNTWFYMPRFYFGIKNILHHILLHVCVRVREEKKTNKSKTKRDWWKKEKLSSTLGIMLLNHFSSSFIYLFIYFVYASPLREIFIQVYIR